MADQIPTLEQQHPILQPVDIKSGAESYDEFAKQLGTFAEKSEQAGEKILTEKSQAMYVHSSALAENIKNDAQERILINPSQGLEIAGQTNEALDAVRKNTVVNSEDRAKLDSVLSKTNSEVHLAGLKSSLNLQQKIAARQWVMDMKPNMNVYQDMIVKNPDQAEKFRQSIIQQSDNLMSAGVLTPYQVTNAMKDFTAIHDDHEDWYKTLKDTNSTAKDYHRAMSNPLRDKPLTGAPIDQGIAFKVDAHVSDHSFKNAVDQLQNHEFPMNDDWHNFTPAQRNEIKQRVLGIKDADGLVYSGGMYPEIVHRLTQLSEKGSNLNYQQDAEKSVYLNYVDKLKKGDYSGLMSQDPQGSQIFQDFNVKSAAIDELRQSELKNIKDPESIQKINAKYDAQQSLITNDRATKMNAWGAQRHIPAEDRKILSQAEQDTISDAFVMGHDPLPAVKVLQQYDKQNQLYITQSLRDHEQKTVMYGAALQSGNLTPTQLSDFIAAQQKGLETDENGKTKYREFLAGSSEDSRNDHGSPNRNKDDELLAAAGTALNDPMDVTRNTYNFSGVQSLQLDMANQTVRYAKYLAQKNASRFDQQDPSSELNNAAAFYTNAFPKKSGLDWVANANQIPKGMPNSDLDVLAFMVKSKGYDSMRDQVGEVKFEATKRDNPLHMIINPVGELEAVDTNGISYFTMPFSSNAVPYAKQYLVDQRKIDTSKSLMEVIHKDTFNSPNKIFG